MSDRDVCVTLERQVSVPGGSHYPAQASVFRCREHSEDDDFYTFFGLNIGPEHTVLQVRKENVRAIATFDIVGGDGE